MINKIIRFMIVAWLIFSVLTVLVLQYEQRINILDEEIEELKNYMEESKEYE